VSASAVIEAGPVTVRGPGSVDADSGCAAVEFVDEQTALVGDEAVATADLWGQVARAAAGGSVDRLVVVHPTWWSARRVDRVCAAAARTASEVIATPRTAAARAGAAGPDPTVVEIGPDVVVISDADHQIVAIARDDDPGRVGGAVAGAVGGCSAVVIDAPADVVGAHELAGLCADSMRANGVSVSRVGGHGIRRGAAALCSAPVVPVEPRSNRRSRRGVAVLAGVVLTTVAAGVAVAGRTDTDVRSDDAVTLLVEGRIGVEVPATWRVERITDGPGSARVQVTSPADPRTALLLVQSPVPASYTQAQAADTLRAALGGQDAGVFVDLIADDRRHGRPVVAYREVRPGRDIDWSVFVDGAVRIAVGCQHPSNQEAPIGRPCREAIRSAHAIF
jgi:type VII secretion-associated protein (TIGR03931 family)